MEKAMAKYKLTKHYAYAEFFIVEANSEDEAYNIVNDYKWNEDPYATYQEFDFQTIELMEEK
jgi:hypothetical protein